MSCIIEMRNHPLASWRRWGSEEFDADEVEDIIAALYTEVMGFKGKYEFRWRVAKQKDTYTKKELKKMYHEVNL
jgi:hypothetical protein